MSSLNSIPSLETDALTSRWRVVTIALLIIFATVGSSGCTPSDSNNQSNNKNGNNDEKLTIAVIPKSTGGEFWETVEAGARQAGDELGVNLKWEGTITETEIAEQNKIIENMINLGVDGMAVAPLNDKATSRSVASAVDADIPVVVFDSSLAGEKHVAFVATDNVAGGALGAKHINEKLGGAGKRVLVLRFVQGTASTENRAKGFIEAVKAAGHQVLADPYPEDGTIAGCKKTASNTLEGFVKGNKLELDAIFACNLTSALGMQAALSDLKKSNIDVDVVFVGFDTSPRLLEGLESGDIDALVSQDPKKMGYLAVETIVKHLQGESIESMVDTGVELVTQERVENEPAIRKLVGKE
ncbi:MAG: substrate-binding domain-containing protein [Planctomycetota bacterium]